MSMQLQMEQMPGYLAARITGAGDEEEAERQFDLIAEHCKRTKNKRLLIDGTGVKTHFSIVDRYYLAKKLWEGFALDRVKIAAVNTEEQIDPQRFGELVAHNRNLNLRGFTDFQAAEKWLLE